MTSDPTDDGDRARTEGDPGSTDSGRGSTDDARSGPVARTQPRRRWFGRTLRVRLTVLLAALIMLACAAVAVATGIATSTFLTKRLDEQLALAGSRYAVSLEHNDNDADNNPETATVGQAVGTLGARVENGKVTAVGVVSGTDTPIVVSHEAREVIAGLTTGTTNRRVDLPGLGEYEVLVTTGRDGDVLVTGLPRRSVDDTLDDVIITEIVVFSVVAVVIGLVGGLAVRRSLRPLERVTATALRVSELPLSSGEVTLTERVRVDDETSEAGQVAAAVNHMLGQIENSLLERQRSENRLRQFVADASHELRTPLAIVRSHAELIELESADFPESVRRSLRSIDSGTGRMGRLVDDLLLLARLDSGVPLERREVDMTRLILDTVGDARIAGPDHRWVLDLPEEPVTLVGDELRLHQVMVNLLANSRRHTPPGSTVSVSLRSLDDGRVEIIVADNGPGIPAPLLPSVAERFVRGGSGRERATGSTGLGLAIVAGIVAAHGGELRITNERVGARVSIVLGESLSGT
ncbi:two-component system, OmpR family, sensor kinase [Nakamurella panacisegetis]|uniref:histidine kinase n=1 Tax=Nakamurella panacisegetis TaxID=1090615 RepID=A0A1H0L054_9ACTN|nr:ATP-binding protein [Nakamurella panacisegetis]SDO61370.1 two-component system, OmpR family, sensor kinase [Nakamurella panacisegetis]